MTLVIQLVHTLIQLTTHSTNDEYYPAGWKNGCPQYNGQLFFESGDECCEIYYKNKSCNTVDINRNQNSSTTTTMTKATTTTAKITTTTAATPKPSRKPSSSLTPKPTIPPQDLNWSQSCAPLDPNHPYTFEPPNNVFPVAPWTTGGDGVWAIDDTNAQEGTYSIKSPDLDGSEGTAVSNATLAICDDFAGGVLMFNTLAPILPPYDILVWYVDGVEISRLAGEPEWSAVPISLPPGAHRIDFQYQYNPFSLPELPNDPPPIRQGAVWIDAVGLQIM